MHIHELGLNKSLQISGHGQMEQLANGQLISIIKKWYMGSKTM